jgi:nitrite reductase/ring-hydroxylating ferredoxin subunit
MNTPVEAAGLWIRESSDALGLKAEHLYLISEIVEGVRQMKGSEAAGQLEVEGLEILHTIIDSTEVGKLRDFVLERNRKRLLDIAVSIGRKALHWSDEFYVDDYLILRINFPYEVAKRADPTAENPGIGRVSAQVRDLAKSRRVIDPVYDPKGYHRNHPPAAWAHGPHQDSWAGHSKDGVNIWWAMCDVPQEASMVLYPEMTGKELPPDPKTLYLAQDFPLPVPTFLPLDAGDMLVFDPEILHGTHLNVTSQTRVAISLRLNSRKPTFDPGCFYAREFWRRASSIESGNETEVLHLKREENLSTESKSPTMARPRLAEVEGKYDNGSLVVPTPASNEAGRIVVRAPDGRHILLYRVDGKPVAVSAVCPHYGLDLSFGGQDSSKLYCPACGVGFSVRTGESGAPSLKLERFDTTEADGSVRIRLDHSAV